MYKKELFLRIPEDENTLIWRYMDFTKFISLLDRQELFFAWVDKLGDPFEGSYTEVNAAATVEEINKSGLSDDIKQRVKMLGANQIIRSHSAINSWHKSDHESSALWELYIRSNQGIAVKSEFCRLRDCFKPNTPDIYIGEVEYIDYSQDAIDVRNYFYPFFYKRNSFEHEKELRALFIDQESLVKGKTVSSNGKGVPVELDTLIDEVYLAPNSPEWIYYLVKSVMGRYGVNKKVVPSSLDNKPTFI
jgi:hypothetical protein